MTRKVNSGKNYHWLDAKMLWNPPLPRLKRIAFPIVDTVAEWGVSLTNAISPKIIASIQNTQHTFCFMFVFVSSFDEGSWYMFSL
jgi:hypothetical protein